MLDNDSKGPGFWALILATKDEMQPRSARENLVALGRKATPVLLRLLKDRQHTVRWKAALDLRPIAMIASAGFLLVFAATNVAGARLAPQTGGRGWISWVAGVGCLVSLVTLLVKNLQDNPLALAAFLIFVGFAVAFELTYGKVRDRGKNAGLGPARNG